MGSPRNMFSVVLVGNHRFPRYAIRDNRVGQGPPKYWTGYRDQPWTSDMKRIATWSEHTGAYLATQDIIRYEMRHLPVRTMTLPLTLTVVGAGITAKQVMEYLEQALHLHLDYANFGMGPTPDSAILMVLDTDLPEEQDKSRKSPRRRKPPDPGGSS